MIKWLDKLLGAAKGNSTLNNHTTVQKPFDGIENLRFGRYSDNNKTQSKVQIWYQAEDLYKEKKYTGSFQRFFEYLTDEKENNVKVSFSEDGTFTFEFIQGSRLVSGYSNGNCIIAKVPLAVMTVPRTAAMRRLLDLNYSLYYSRTALDDNNTLYMLFETDIPSASPNKLYYGLRELAIKADRHDDLLIADFETLEQADIHLQPLPDKELEVKFIYFRLWIEEILHRTDALNQDSFSGAIAYMLLSVMYRIDFLIMPEANLLTSLEQINAIYWEKKEEVPLVERNRRMKAEIKKLLDISFEDFAKSVYRSTGTFSITSPSKPEKVKEYISNANKDANWYIENKHPDIALNLNEYGMLHNQFVFSMPKVQTDITAVYMAVLQSEFFSELGLKTAFYDKEKKEFNKPAIESAIDEAIEPYKEKYKKMKWDHSRTRYTSVYEFGISISEQLANMNLETKRA